MNKLISRFQGKNKYKQNYKQINKWINNFNK